MKRNLLISIDKATTAAKYITWAMQEDDPKKEQEWLKEAELFLELAKEWLNKE